MAETNTPPQDKKPKEKTKTDIYGASKDARFVAPIQVAPEKAESNV